MLTHRNLKRIFEHKPEVPKKEFKIVLLYLGFRKYVKYYENEDLRWNERYLSGYFGKLMTQLLN